MSKRYYGSINLDEVIKAIKTGKINTYKADNGNRYVNINLWINDKPDQFENDGSLQLSFKKEYQQEKKIYIGNIREAVPKEATVKENELDDLPF